MTPNQLFPFTVAVLCAAASGIYLYQGNWKLGIIWACWSVADVVVAL